MADMKDKLKEIRKSMEEKSKGEASLGMTKEDREETQKKVQEEMKKPQKKAYDPQNPSTYKKGGMVRSSASKRADGCAQRGKTRGKMV
jgi:hypothetical protein